MSEQSRNTKRFSLSIPSQTNVTACASTRRMGTLLARLGSACAAALWLMLSVAAPVEADTFTVTNTDDSGLGSLRLAILEANTNPGADIIDFNVTGTITLTSSGFVVTDSVTIAGPGSSELVIDCSAIPLDQIFVVQSGVVQISGITVTNTENAPINNQGADLTLVNSTVSHFGSGVENGGTLTVTNSTIGPGESSAISNGGTATVTDSTIYNTYDAGISNGATGILTLINSTLSSHEVWGLVNYGTATVTNSTITENGSTNPTEGNIFNNGTLTLSNSFVSKQFHNDDQRDCAGLGVLNSGGYNLDSDGTCFTHGVNNDITSADPGLAPLGDYGGSTQTHALQVGSPAIDRIPADINGCGNMVATDQRGVTRPRDGDGDGTSACDIGAYEWDRFLVTNTNDAGPGSLRQAILNANAYPGADIIDINATGTISLISGGFSIGDPVTIIGPGASSLTIDGNGTGLWVFEASAGVVELSDLTVTDSGFCNSQPNDRHAFTNLGADLKLTRVRMENNCGHDIVNDALLTVTNSTFYGGGWGGIANSGSGSLTVTDSTFYGSYASGITNYGTAIVTDSTFSEIYDYGVFNRGVVTITNSTMSTYSGALYNHASGAATVINSTLSGSWGWVWNTTDATLTVINSTISDNFQDGIHNDGTATLNSSTISGNRSSGILNNGTVTLTNTIIAAQEGGDPDCNNTGTIISNGYNLDSDGTCVTHGVNNDVTNAAPVLYPLQDNGGPTQTHALHDGPAIDGIPAGVNGCGDTLVADQRGSVRPRDGDGDGTSACDMGAFESSRFFVTNTNDSGPGSLRQAILDANAQSGMEEVVFGDTSGTIMLTSGELLIDDSLVIRGPGAAKLTIDGNDTFQVFGVNAGVVRIDGLTLTGGAGQWGAVFNRADLTVTDSAIHGNSGVSAGGLYNESSGSLTVVNSTVSGNQAGGLEGGGGIHNDGGTTTISNSTISGNTAAGGPVSGAIRNARGGALTITDSTISDSNGAGLVNDVLQGPSEVVLTNSIIASQAAGPDCVGAVISDGYNLDSDGTCNLIQATDLPGTDPQLGPLADNGGPTLTHALSAGSPAIDSGYYLFGDQWKCPDYDAPEVPRLLDQRGMQRPLDGNADDEAWCDRGAFETRILEGRIIDPELQLGLPGVTVTLNSGPVTTSDGNGVFFFVNVPDGDHTVSVSYSSSDFSFSPVSRVVTVAGTGELDVNLDFVALGSFTISGSVNQIVSGAPISGVRVFADTGANVLTASDGSYSLTLPFGIRELRLSLHGHTFKDNPRTVPLNNNIVDENFVGTDRLPIVMVHGIFDNPSVFTDEKATLEAAGYVVAAPALQTSFLYTPPVWVNAQRVMDAIDDVIQATGAAKVIIVAHSMGSIVSRSYIEGGRYRGDVQALFTFGGPHQGVPFDPLVALIAIHNPAYAFFACSLQPCELSQTGMYYFNNLHHRRPGVEYHVIGGEVPSEDIRLCIGIPIGNFCLGITIRYKGYPTLRFPWDAMATLGGPSVQTDGFVSTGSSLGLSGRLDRWRTIESHSHDHGREPYFRAGLGTSNHSFKACLAGVLVRKDRTACGTVSTSQNLAASPQHLAAPSGMTQPAAGAPMALPTATDTPIELNQRTPLQSGVLNTGEVATLDMNVDGGVTAFVASWDEGTVDVALIDPIGQRIDPDFVADNPEQMLYEPTLNGATYYLADAVGGTWQMELSNAAGIPVEGTDYQALAMFHSALALSVGTDQDVYHPGDTATITATLSDTVAAASVVATVIYGDGTEQTVNLAEVGAGQYSATYTLEDLIGYTTIQVKATGTRQDGNPFAREATTLVQVSPADVLLTQQYTETAVPRSDYPALYEKLTIGVQIDASIAREIVLSADLVDSAGDPVAHAVMNTSVSTGISEQLLHFDGRDILTSQRDGPYRLTNVLLGDPGAGYLVLDQANDAYNTAAYGFREFAERNDAPDVFAGGPYTVVEGSSISLQATGIDPEDDALSYAWDLDEDGVFETPGQSPSFSAADIDAPHTRILTVQTIDDEGFTAIDQTTLDVFNATPVVDAGDDVAIDLGQTFVGYGSFTDPGDDIWTATVDYGDGLGAQPLALTGTSFELSWQYTATGVYTVTVTIIDDDGAEGVDTITATVNGTGKIGDFVWHDLNGNGIQDPGEPGLAEVTVRLQSCGGSVLAIQSTDGNGNYLFDGLPAETYRIEFTMPTGFVFSPFMQGPKRGEDSNADPATGLTNCLSMAEGQSRRGIDAGLIRQDGSGQIGDLVWEDLDGDGIQDPGEPGLGGVNVTLLDCAGNEVTMTTSDANGAYLFDGLFSGQYRLRFDTPMGLVSSPARQGTNRGKDSDPDPVTGETFCLSMAEGQSRRGIDAGLIRQPVGTGQIGDFVWHDSNGSGIQNPGEPGLEGVTVRLQSCGGVVLATTQTDASGQYGFSHLAAGSYKVEFQTPAGFVFSPQRQGNNRGKDSDPDPATGLTFCLSMPEGKARLGIDVGMID